MKITIFGLLKLVNFYYYSCFKIRMLQILTSIISKRAYTWFMSHVQHSQLSYKMKNQRFKWINNYNKFREITEKCPKQVWFPIKVKREGPNHHRWSSQCCPLVDSPRWCPLAGKVWSLSQWPVGGASPWYTPPRWNGEKKTSRKCLLSGLDLRQTINIIINVCD